jgi:uncharacterized RDD family membrane protein YckC
MQMNSTEARVKYPGCGKRFLAWLTDAVIVGIVIFLARLMFFAACMQLQVKLPGGKVAILSLIIGIVIAIVYHTFFESSKLQATPGKLVLGLIVTDLKGDRISPQRAFARHMSKYASAFSFGIGYLLLFFSKKRQCLHDMIANCTIRQKTAS